jgi:hypothetical protein
MPSLTWKEEDETQKLAKAHVTMPSRKKKAHATKIL